MLPLGGRITDWHTYAVEWEPGLIRWFVSGVQTQAQSFWWSSTRRDGAKATAESELHPGPAPFDRPLYLVMNLAVGGNFLGNPDATTRFPGVMEVDFVRAYVLRNRTNPVRRQGRGTFPWTTK